MPALKKNRLLASVLALVALAAVVACNNVADNPGNSDTFVEVLSATPVTSNTTATTVSDSTTLSLQAQPRNPNATTFFNDVTFTSYDLAYSSLLTSVSGLPTTGVLPAGGSTSLTLVVVPAASKMGSLAGNTISVAITVHGKDASGHSVSFTAGTTITFI